MKKYIAAISTAVTFLSVASSAFADTTLGTCATGFTALCNLTTANFGGLVGTVIQFVFVISVVAALLYLIWGGFKWLTSGGDKTAVSSARDHIIAAIIGLIVIFLAYLIINLLLGLFNLGNLNTLTLPNIQG